MSNQFRAKLICRTGYVHQPCVTTSISELIGNDAKRILYLGYDYAGGLEATKTPLLDGLDRIRKNFVLITDIDDYCVPFDEEGNFLTPKEFETVYRYPYLRAWYSVNLVLPDNLYPKLHHLPIGLDYHTIANRSYWGMPKSDEHVQELQLVQLHLTSNTLEERKLQCLADFTNSNNNRFKFSGMINFSRQDVLDCAKTNPSIDLLDTPLPRKHLWSRYLKYVFVIAPSGHGLATHRIWEALSLGCIVITDKTSLDSLYRLFPVVTIEDLDEIHPVNLHLWYENFKGMTQNPEIRRMLLTSYWVETMLSHTSSDW